jgi:hypothetical protein
MFFQDPDSKNSSQTANGETAVVNGAAAAAAVSNDDA